MEFIKLWTLKVTLDPEHAKCSICLNVWHDVVTVAPCLHNFCNGCFSEWLKRCQINILVFCVLSVEELCNLLEETIFCIVLKRIYYNLILL
ncbi:hypothetical protein ACS0TY_014211 [Phlomoides rotata]